MYVGAPFIVRLVQECWEEGKMLWSDEKHLSWLRLFIIACEVLGVSRVIVISNGVETWFLFELLGWDVTDVLI